MELTNIIVDYKAVGFEGALKVEDLPEATIKAALVYGVRRMIQDSCNSEAFKLRQERKMGKDEELPEADRKTIHEARLGAMKDGTIGVRSSSRGTTDLSPELARVLQEDRKTIIKDSGVDPAEYKAADNAGRTKMLADWMNAQDEMVKARWEKKGAALLKIDSDRAKAIAALDL